LISMGKKQRMMGWRVVCCGGTVEMECLDDMPNQDGSLEYEGSCFECGKTFQLTIHEDEFAEEDTD
jgi:alkylated DNA nucleotide flippase Atl1